jgi:hypothetical protein
MNQSPGKAFGVRVEVNTELPIVEGTGVMIRDWEQGLIWVCWEEARSGRDEE